MEIELLGKRMLVKQVEPYNRPGDAAKKASVLLSADGKQSYEFTEDDAYDFGEIMSVGPDVETVKVGDKAIFPLSFARKYIEGQFILKEGEILGTYTV